MKYLLPCPACGRQITVETGQAGQILQCGCGKQVDVPTIRGMRELETVVEESVSRSGWNRRRGFMFVGGVVAVIGLLLAGYVWIVWPSIDDAAAIGRELHSMPPFASFLRLQSLEPPLPSPALERAESAPQLAPSKKLLIQMEGAGPQSLTPQQTLVSYDHLRVRHNLSQLLPIALFIAGIGALILIFGFLSKGERSPRRTAKRPSQRARPQAAKSGPSSE
jgi:hypothetical protein